MMQRPMRAVIVLAMCALLSLPAMARAEEKEGFEFHGYMRAGFDFNTKIANPESGDLRLSQMATDAHSRFGNEGNRSYFEPTFQYNWKQEQSQEFWKMVLTFSTFYNEGANDAGDTAFNNRQAYVQGGGFDFSPSMKIWAGNRYYGREYLPELDWFFTNLIGYGAGVEDVSVANSKLNVAWIAVHNGQGAWEANNLLYEDEELDEKVGELQENNFDFALHSIPLGKNVALKMEVNLKYINGGTIGFDTNEDGIEDSFGEVEDQLGYYFLGKLAWNPIGTFYGMYLSGAAASKGPGGWSDSFHRDIGRDLDPGDFTDGTIDYDDRYQYHLIYYGEFQRGNWGLNPYFVYDFYTNDESGGAKDERTWIDVGFRTNYAFNDLMSVILDTDYAYQIREAGVSGGADETTPQMFKITPAFALSAGRFMSSRPTIRFYATYAFWNDDAKNDLSAIAHEVDDSDYLKFGIQAEAWW
jgi:maltoporin